MRRGCRSALSIRTASCHAFIHSCKDTIDISHLGKLARRKGSGNAPKRCLEEALGSWRWGHVSAVIHNVGVIEDPCWLFCADPIDKT